MERGKGRRRKKSCLTVWGWSQSLDKLSIKSRLKLGLSSPENGNDVNIIIKCNNLIT